MADLISKGNYTGKGFGVPELGESTEKKTPFVRVAIQIQGGEFDGRIVNRDLYFSEKTTARTMEVLRNLGCTFPGNDITDFTGYGSTAVNFTVEHESYEKDGETKTVAKIGFINSAGGINAAARMDEAQKAAFRAKMMGTVAASAGAQKTTNGPAASKAPF
jgi:hypothetical protein